MMTEQNLSRLDGVACEFLQKLGHKHAFVVPREARNGVVSIVQRGAKGDKVIVSFSQSIWTKFVAMGLVEPGAPRHEWRLTTVGKRTVKSIASRSKKHAGGGKKRLPSTRLATEPRTNDHESPLTWLAKRKDRDGNPMIGEAEFAAGERLRRDFCQAHLQPKVTMDWSRALSTSGGRRRCAGVDSVLINDVVARARERVNAALHAVGPELSGILIEVCCHLNGLEQAEQDAGWPRRAGKIILRLALTRLARHYGLMQDDRRGEKNGVAAVRHWGSEGYRPGIDSGEPTHAP